MKICSVICVGAFFISGFYCQSPNSNIEPAQAIEKKQQSIDDKKVFIENSNYYTKLNAELKLEFEQNSCNATANANLGTFKQLFDTLVENTLTNVSTQYRKKKSNSNSLTKSNFCLHFSLIEKN